MPAETFVTQYEFNALDKRLTAEINNLRDEAASHALSLAELNVKYDNLADLPKTITDLNQTLGIVSQRLESMNTNMNFIKESIDDQKQAIRDLRKENRNQNDNISKIDNKSKVDWAAAITGNFWNVLGLIAVFVYIIREFVLK